jgi:hypothetical protein
MSHGAQIDISEAIEFSDLSPVPQLAHAADPLLCDLVRLADTLNVEHGISLTVGGSLITGTLFSAYRFFEGQATAAAGGAVIGSQIDAAKTYQQHMVEFYVARMKMYDPARLMTEGSHYVPRYIHIHNARWVGNDGMFTGESKLWRGRLIAISGFAITQV